MCEELEKVVVGTNIEKYFQIKVQLPFHENEKLLAFLRRNADVFAWSAYKALGVDPKFIFHHLNVNPKVVPKKQPPWHSSKEHAKAVVLSRMASQYSGGEEAREVESVCRFH